MKYRTGFVTNSSSSSSIIVTLKGRQNENHIKFSFDEPGYWSFDSFLGFDSRNIDYNDLVSYLVNARLGEMFYEVYEKKNHNVELTKVLGISNNGGYILETNLLVMLGLTIGTKYREQYEYLRDLHNAKNTFCRNYDDFVKHPIWGLLADGKIDPKDIQYLKEERDFRYSDGEESSRTIVEVGALKIEQRTKGIDYSETNDEEYDFCDEDFDEFDYSFFAKPKNVSKNKKVIIEEEKTEEEDELDSIFFF